MVRVTGDMVTLCIRVPKPIKEAVDRLVASQKMSIGAAARVYLAAGIDAIEKKQG